MEQDLRRHPRCLHSRYPLCLVFQHVPEEAPIPSPIGSHSGTGYDILGQPLRRRPELRNISELQQGVRLLGIQAVDALP